MALPSLVDSVPSLWTLIDDFVLDLCTVWKDKWLETADATVEVGEQYDPDSVALPMILIRSYERSLAEADAIIGDGEYHLSRLVYPYEIVVAASFGDFRIAKEFTAAASATLVDDLRADATMGGLQSDNGETVLYLDFDDGELFVRGRAGQNQGGKYVGTALIRFMVYTEV